ncbi:MAG: YihY/virulence factor BrkB family protein, partial [Pirellulales bacterium]
SGGANQEQSQGGGSGWSVPSIITNIASVLVLIFGATGIMAQLQMSLNQMWEIEPDPDQGGISGFLKKRLVSLAMILAIAFLLLVSMLLTTAVSAFGEWISSTLGVQRLGSYAISEGTTIIIVTILFAAMFKFLPDAEVPWKVTWVGALMTALLFTVGKFLIGLYLGSKDMSSAYGQAGSLVLVLLWVYYTAIIFFFGAELTQVWARRHGHAIQPAEGAMRVVVRKESVPAPGG